MEQSDNDASYRVSNSFTSELFNVTDVENIVNFPNIINESQNAVNNEYPKITEDDSYKLWLLLNDWNLGYLHKTCIGKITMNTYNINVNITNLKNV